MATIEATTEQAVKSRSYAGEADIQPVCDLLNLCNDVDQLDEGYLTPDEWQRRLDEPGVEKERDLRLWENAASRLVGLGQVWKNREDDGEGVDGYLRFRVPPEQRGKGIESQIIAWGSERIREIGRERGQPAQLRTGLNYRTPEYVAYHQALLEEHSFVPVRYWFKMARNLNEPIPEPRLPEGFTMRHAQGEEDFAPWVEVFNQSFIDHWNHHPITIEEHRHWLQNPNYSPERSLIAIAPDGTFAAFCFCWIDPEDNAHYNRKEGWIDILGTRRGFRKIGLGTAMLLAGMRRLKADGMDTAVLGVDAENPSGALRLYESVGFYTVHKQATYHKDL